MVTVRYFAGARAAAGVAEEDVPAGTLGELKQCLTAGRDRRFAAILAASSLMSDGRPLDNDETVLADRATVEVLPPFAGG